MQNELKEACLILPLIGNDGSDLSHVHSRLMDAILGSFGGCTAVEAQGTWTDADGKVICEPVVRYIVAMETHGMPGAKNEETFERIARDFGAQADQKSVYVRFGSGRVAILNL